MPTFAAVYEAVTAPYKFNEAPEYQAILATLKTYGEFKKVSPPEPEKPRVLSRGEQMVEEAKARNRAKLAEMYKAEKDKGVDTRGELQKWKEEEKKNLESWKKESRDQLNTWKREQEIFLGRIKVYKENTFPIPAKIEKIVEKKIPEEALPQVHIVNATFSVPMKDQSARPTCVAFAGIRAVEILLAQNNIQHDLSEQYLYWAGKPKCQKSPCDEKGSWIREAYRFSSSRPFIDIPLESQCAYKTESIENNETQLPLPETCKDGTVKVGTFEEVKTLSDVVSKIKSNIPVIVAARLTENFYRNKGLVTLSESESSGKKLDSHSLGHAFLAVGVMELPEKLRPTEGDYCLVIANSWGKGWGAGGYGCLTEKWLIKQRQPSSFISPVKVSVK